MKTCPEAAGESPNKNQCQAGCNAQKNPGGCGKAKGVLGRPLAIFLEVIGAAAAIFAVWDAYWNTLPQVRLLEPELLPSSFMPFAVTNPSHLFDMNSLTLRCAVGGIKEGTKDEFVSSLETAAPPGPTISIGSMRNFVCPVGGQRTTGVELSAKYWTLLIPRTWTGPSFTWHPEMTPPRWVEGIL